MALLFLLGLFFLVLYDARFLNRADPGIFKKVFTISETNWALLTFILPIVVLPLYLFRRFRFKRSFHSAKDLGPSSPTSFTLASDAMGLLLIWILGMGLVEIFIQAIEPLFPDFEFQLGGLIISAVFSFLLSIALIYRITRKYSVQGFLSYVGLIDGKISLMKMLAVSWLAGAVFAGVSSWIIVARPVQPATPLSRIVDSTTSPSLLFIFIGLAVLFAPFCEEIIFRGYFYQVLRRYKGKVFAVVVISSVFAFLHIEQYWGDWAAIAVVALLGVTLTLLRVWAGTTISSIITHYVYNIGITIIPMILVIVLNPSFQEYRMRYDDLSVSEKERLLITSIEARPEFSDAYNELAWLYAEEGIKLEEGLDLIDKALAARPGSHMYLDTKAEVLYRMDRLQEAIEIQQQITQENPHASYYQEQLQKYQDALADLSDVPQQ